MAKFHQSIIKLVVGTSAVHRSVAGGPAGTGGSSTCDGDVQGGEWCNIDSSNCQAGCGGRWCTNDTGGPPSTTQSPNPGVQTATTTRYWDCSGGACGCSFIPTGFHSNEPVHCHSNAMFVAPSGNPYGAKFYGAAAISASLGGGDWMSEGCGKCWSVTAESNAPGFEGETSTLVLKGTNFCPDANPSCAAGPHFDIAAPGFDVLAYSFANTCKEREPDEEEGFTSCGNWLISDQDPDNNCDCSLFKSPVLRAGCENFYSLKWDNPIVTYEEVGCPAELSALHCSHPYATEANMPDTCANSIFSASSSTDASSTIVPPQTTEESSTSSTTATTHLPPQTTTTSSTSTSSSTTASKAPRSKCCSWCVVVTSCLQLVHYFIITNL
eukprot:scaffold2207_cov271-Alexandrium_tamarense.AAC.5